MIDPSNATRPYEIVPWPTFRNTQAYTEVAEVLTRHGYRLVIFPSPSGYMEARAVIEMVNADKAGK